MEAIALRETSVILRRFDKKNSWQFNFSLQNYQCFMEMSTAFQQGCNVWSSKGLTEGAIIHCSSQELWDCNSNHSHVRFRSGTCTQTPVSPRCTGADLCFNQSTPSKNTLVK